LDASLESRAQRRYKENQERGIQGTYEELKQSMAERDYNDKNKEVGALKITDESVIIDSSDMTIAEVVDKVVEIINNVRSWSKSLTYINHRALLRGRK